MHKIKIIILLEIDRQHFKNLYLHNIFLPIAIFVIYYNLYFNSGSMIKNNISLI